MALQVKIPQVSHHPTSFGHKQCGSGDIMVLVCQKISQDQIIKGTYEFMGENPGR